MGHAIIAARAGVGFISIEWGGAFETEIDRQRDCKFPLHLDDREFFMRDLFFFGGLRPNNDFGSIVH